MAVLESRDCQLGKLGQVGPLYGVPLGRVLTRVECL